MRARGRQLKRIALVIEYDDGSIELIGSNEIVRAEGRVKVAHPEPELFPAALGDSFSTTSSAYGLEIDMRVESRSDYEGVTWARLDRWPL